jgi:hypothetical protein
VKGHPITIGQILADFVASCNCKIVEILTEILLFQERISRWAVEMSQYLRNQYDTKMRLVPK